MNPNDHRRIDLRPSSVPPEASQVDASWDDETVPGLDLDDPLNEFDRVTVVPDLPSDLYVQQVMGSAEDSGGVTSPSSLPPVEPDERFMEPDEYFTVETRPPARRSADSTAPYPAISLQNAPTARPAAPATRGPGVPAGSPSSAGLELVDLSFDSISSLKAAPRVDAQAHDPRDPVLELSFDEAREPNSVAASSPLGDMKDRYAMGDFSGALVIAEGILEGCPEDLAAARYAQTCRDVLTQMYCARLGSLDQIVSIAVPGDQIRWLTLDHRAGFLLSLVDGGSTLDQILDISGMTRLDALRIMFQLLDQRVIALG